MLDQDKSKQQLLEELAEMRRREAQWRSLVSNDVTQQKQAEAPLRESEERFKLFMDNSPAIAWMKDEQGRYVYVNESCARRMGLRPEERIGKTDFELWPSAIAELFWKNDQKVLSEGQVVEVVEESVKPDGSRSYCRNFKFPTDPP
jgi:PAS domain S-box-containing protein